MYVGLIVKERVDFGDKHANMCFEIKNIQQLTPGHEP